MGGKREKGKRRKEIYFPSKATHNKDEFSPPNGSLMGRNEKRRRKI